MNTTYIKRVLSSISAKLFISFWLIALLSIFTTRFISGQFTDNSLILPAHMGDLRQLHKVARLTLVNQPQTIDGFLTLIKKKYAEPQTRRPINVIIKNSDTNQIYSFPKNHPGIDNYLIKNHFTDVISVEFPHTRLTGP